MDPVERLVPMGPVEHMTRPVPLDTLMNLVRLPKGDTDGNGRNIWWCKPFEFVARLHFEGFATDQYGKSYAVLVYWTGSESLHYPIHLRDLEIVMKLNKWNCGSFYGKWGFIEREDGYGIRLVGSGYGEPAVDPCALAERVKEK